MLATRGAAMGRLGDDEAGAALLAGFITAGGLLAGLVTVGGLLAGLIPAELRTPAVPRPLPA